MPIRRRTAGAIGAVAVLVAIALASFTFAYENLPGKPLWHIAAFAALALSSLTGVVWRSPAVVGLLPTRAFVTAAALATLAVSVELGQIAFLGSALEEGDIAANLLGYALGAAVWLVLRVRSGASPANRAPESAENGS